MAFGVLVGRAALGGNAPTHSNNRGPRPSSDPCKYFGQCSHAASSTIAVPTARWSPQLDIEGAFAAMADAGGGIAKHHGSQLRSVEPARYAAAEHAAGFLAERFSHVVAARSLATLAGDDQDGLEAARVCIEQEGAQAGRGIALAQTVQIDAGFDLELAGGDATRLAAIEIGERRRR
jgi:hypothetical protein